VTDGTVQFSDGADVLGEPVALDGTGTASLTTSTLAVGSRPITAAYSGTSTYPSSRGSVTQVVRGPTADAGGPYTVAEGDSLSLDASASTPAGTYAWDVNGDGDFTDATGATPTLTWSQISALGIDDGPASGEVAVRVTVEGTSSTSAPADLTVRNTAPAVTTTGARTATVGTPFTLKLGADDPSTPDLTDTFTYTADWGDGSPAEAVTGPAAPPVTHTYTSAGTRSATFTATDRDGGVSAPLTIQVQVVAVAPTPSPTTTPTPSPTPTASPTTSPTPTPTPDAAPNANPGPPLATTGLDAGRAGAAASALLLLGLSLAAVAVRRRRA